MRNEEMSIVWQANKQLLFQFIPLFILDRCQFVKKEIIYTTHLQLRIKLRDIPYKLPQKICEEAEERYFDSKTNYSVAVDNINYKGKIREMAVVYQEAVDKIEIVTIHPLKIDEKLSKIKNRRWIKKWKKENY